MERNIRVLALLLTANFLFVFTGMSAQAQDRWSDTFADTSLIQSLDKAIHVSETTEFGKNFTPYSGNPLLSLETSDPWDANSDITKQIPGAVHADVLYFPEGNDGYGNAGGYKFWMVFTPAPETGSVPPGGSGSPDYWWERMTLLRSNDGINWEKTLDYTNPLVSPGAPGEWDDGWHADPDLVYAPGKGPGGASWFLYYTGCGSAGCRIALATSVDGKTYTKYPTAVSQAFRCPAVIYDESTEIFHMWYNWGSFQIGYATSLDGINWTPYNPINPGQWGSIVMSGTPGTFDQGGITHMDVIRYDGKYWMYYLALPTAQYSGLVIGLATSPDGINWTKHPTPVVTPSGQTWNFTGVGIRTVQSLYRPSAVVVGDSMYLYYGGTDDYVAYPAHNYEIGVALSTKTPPEGYVQLDRYFSSSEYDPRPDETMAWYHMNEGSFTPTYPGQYSPQSNTLAWYHFNEGSGPTAIDSGGSVVDNGTLNDPMWITGLYGGGLSFDGNDRITVLNSSELNPTDAVTIEAWVRPMVSKENNYVAIKMTPGTGDYVYGLKINNSEIWAFIAVGGTLYWSYSSNLVPVNSWTHIAMSYEKSPVPTRIKLYMNGVEVSYRLSITIPANTSIPANSGPLNIGVIPTASPTYYQGIMDEVRILGRALTPAEIAADGAVSASLVLDSSGNDNHGTPSSSITSTTGMFSSPGISFNGTNGFFSAQHDESLNTEEEVTIEAWVKPLVNKLNNYVAIKMVPASSYTYSYGLKLESQYAGYSEIGGVIQGSGGQAYFAYGGNVPLGVWTHIAMTYKRDAMNNTHIRLFQNGVEVPYRYGAPNDATDTIPPNTLIRTHTGPLFVGVIPVTSPPAGNYFFNGTMDEVRILRRALTPDEILIEYGEGYEPSGNLNSVLVTPPAGKGWDRFYASDERPGGTNVTYSIVAESGEVLLANVSNGDDISSIADTPISLFAELTTNAPTQTPFVDEWAVTWKNLNRAPMLSSPGDRTVAELATLTFDLSATDPDLNTLTYNISSGIVGGMELNASTGAFSWIPTEAQGPGTYPVTFGVTDNGIPPLSDQKTITITVNEVNLPPVLAAIGSKTVDEIVLLSFTATATDTDFPLNTLSFSLAGTVPPGASITSAGAFSWTPSEAQGPGSYTFDVCVNDGAAVDCETITVTVNEVNLPPVLASIGNQGIDEMTLLSFMATATDPDLPAYTLAFSLAGTVPAGTVPAGASITSAGAFTWTPTEAQGPGSYTFDVCVNDGSPNVCETITVTVNEVNRNPVLAAIGDKTVQWSDMLTLTATATDPDIPDNTLTFSLQVDAPEDASIDPSTGVFTWIPTEGQASGAYSFTIKVCDNGTSSLCDQETITVTVNPEDADVVFYDDNPVAVQVAEDGGNSGQFFLSAEISELIPDVPEGLAYPGDISLANVSMTLQPVGPGSPVSRICTKSDVVETEDGAFLPVTCTFNAVPVNTYALQVTVNGGYYTGGDEDVLVVYDPSLGFATGGGWFYWPGTDDGEQGTENYYPGDKTNFGFTMKYNKKGTNVQGSLLLIRHLPDGSIVDCGDYLVCDAIYRVKSNALHGLALGDSLGYGWASFSGKSTYLDPCMDTPDGGYEFVVYVEDRNEPGTGVDTFWIQVKDKNGNVILEMSMPVEATDNALPIQRGNIVVPHRAR